jgi:hypothetical protein
VLAGIIVNGSGSGGYKVRRFGREYYAAGDRSGEGRREKMREVEGEVAVSARETAE